MPKLDIKNILGRTHTFSGTMTENTRPVSAVVEVNAHALPDAPLTIGEPYDVEGFHVGRVSSSAGLGVRVLFPEPRPAGYFERAQVLGDAILGRPTNISVPVAGGVILY